VCTTSFFRKPPRTSCGSRRREHSGGIIITRDDRIRYNQLEKQAVLAAKLRFFSITSSSLTGDEAASLILSAVRAMTRLCREQAAAGFIAKISRGPEVRIIEKGRR
jgi:hypothetical protein